MRPKLAVRISLFVALSLTSNPASAGRPADWHRIFDGTSIADWEHVGLGSITLQDALLSTHGGMGLLYWKGGPVGD